MQNITIEPATDNQWTQIKSLIFRVFEQSEFGYHEEAELVESIQDDANNCISLIAKSGEEIVGHIFFSPGTIVSLDGTETFVMALGPMVVETKYQRQGIGKKLIESGFDHLIEAGVEFVMVLGHKEYYPKFGFEPGADWSITHGFQQIPQEYFFVKRMGELTFDRNEPLQAFYHRQFGLQHA